MIHVVHVTVYLHLHVSIFEQSSINIRCCQFLFFSPAEREREGEHESTNESSLLQTHLIAQVFCVYQVSVWVMDVKTHVLLPLRFALSPSLSMLKSKANLCT